MTLKALIFDVDGTLAETEELHRRAFNETFAEAGLDWCWSQEDYTDLLKTTGGKERMKVHRDALGQDSPDDAAIADLHGLKTARYGELMRSGAMDLRPGVRDIIDEARANGLRLAVATTTNRPNVEALTQACWGQPADAVFDVVAAGDEVAAKKPAPDVFDLALARLNLSATDAIAFEDSRNGLLSAKAAGLRVVMTPSAYTAAEDHSEADLVLDHLAGLSCLSPLIG